MRKRVVETRDDRMALAHDAGMGALSPLSVLAGVLVSYGSFIVLAAITGGVLAATGMDSTSDVGGDLRDLTIGTGIVVGLVQFLSYFFGGYVGGRMARRAGAANGAMVAVLGLLIAVGIGAAISTQADTDAIVDNLRSVGVPTTMSEWTGIGAVAGAGVLLAMLLGGMVGGMGGERWHGKLVTRALDPDVGPAIDLREPARETVPNGNGDAEWDGENRTRVLAGTSTTLDEDLYRHRKVGDS